MKKITYLFIFFTLGVYSQTQIGNNDFELWDNLGQTNEEPANWNGFKTASGAWNSFGSQQVKQSTDTRPGSTGSYSAQIWTKNVTLAIANGNITLGRINMGSTTPTSSDNYNYSQTNDVQFSESLTQIPDSIVFWAKFSPIDVSHEARISCVIHDNIDFKDPNDLTSTSKVADAIYNFSTTNGSWVRKSYPFTKTGNINAQFILVTFTSNKTPGVGTDNGSESTRDNLWIDDVELIYSSTSGLKDEKSLPFFVSVKDKNLFINTQQHELNNISIIDTSGKSIYKNSTTEQNIKVELETGFYIVRIENNNKCFNTKVLIY